MESTKEREKTGEMMKKYICHICSYWSWAMKLPEHFINENTHKSCAERLEKSNEYTRPWKEKVERDIEELKNATRTRLR